MANKENIKSLKDALIEFTNAATKAENAVGQLFALGSRTNTNLTGTSTALDDMAKSVKDIGGLAVSAAAGLDAFTGNILSATSEGRGFTEFLTDITAGLTQTLPDAVVGFTKLAAGAFDGPTRTLRAYDAQIFEIGKKFGAPIEESKRFADSIMAIPASEFGQALSMTRDELTKYYEAAGNTSLTQEVLNESVSTGIGETNLLAAATAFGESANMSAYRTMNLLNAVINKQGVAASEAADMLGVYAGVAKEVGLQIDDVANTLNGAVSQFGKLGISADFGAPVLEGFGRVVKDMGLGIEQTTSLTQGLTSSLGKLTEDYGKAYIMFQRGGLDFGAGGGALGASIGLQAELLKAEKTGDQAAIGAQLVGAMRDTIASFGGGNIVTVSEAAESPELQTQFYTQQQLLMNQFGISDQSSATRTLELLAEIDEATRSGNLDAKEELQKQLENEVEGRDKTLDVLEQIEREISAQSSLMMLAARDDLEAIHELGVDLAQVFAVPLIREGGAAGIDTIESAGDTTQQFLGRLRQAVGIAGIEEFAKVSEKIPKKDIEKAAQDSTNIALSATELKHISSNQAIREKQLSKEDFQEVFKQAVVEALAESDRDLSGIPITIDFADPELARVFKAMQEVTRQAADA